MTGPLLLRRLNIDLDPGFSRLWNGGDAFATHFFNALSMMFPEGEQYFVDVTRAFLPDLERSHADALARTVREFVNQESAHRAMHARYNRELARQGYCNRVEARIRVRIRIMRWFALRSRLAVVLAYEHFTAVLGDGFLRYPEWSQAMEEPLKTVWAWHAAEETEHKSVAFDVYRAAGGGYLRRVLWFFYVSSVFSLDILWQTASLLRQDQALMRRSTWHSAFRLWWGTHGIGRHIIPHWLAYLSPKFHPSNHDNRMLIAQWRAAYEGRYRIVGEDSSPEKIRHASEPPPLAARGRTGSDAEAD